MADRLKIELPEERDEPVTRIGIACGERLSSSEEVDEIERGHHYPHHEVAFCEPNSEGVEVLSTYKHAQYYERFFPGLRPDQITWEMVRALIREISGG